MKQYLIQNFLLWKMEILLKKILMNFIRIRRLFLFGLPGAYTSVCSAKHLPGYVDNYEKYKAKGVDLHSLYLSK